MYGLRSTLQEEATKAKISEDDRKKIEEQATAVLDWLQRNEMAEQEEFEYKLKGTTRQPSPFARSALAGTHIL